MTLLLCSNDFSGRGTARHASQLFTGSDCGTVIIAAYNNQETCSIILFFWVWCLLDMKRKLFFTVGNGVKSKSNVFDENAWQSTPWTQEWHYPNCLKSCDTFVVSNRPKFQLLFGENLLFHCSSCVVKTRSNALILSKLPRRPQS